MKIDVYETEDLPESDQINFPILTDAVFESDSIETIKINVEESLKKFEGKFLDSKTADFSDNISNKKLGYGFLEDPKVSLTRKIESLRSRIKHLAEEVQITKSRLEEEEEVGGPGSDIFEDIDIIRNQLVYLSKTSSTVNTTLIAPQSNFVSKLNKIVDKEVAAGKKEMDAGDTDNMITYQLLKWPDNKSIDRRKLASIEASIKRCENVIGDWPRLAMLKENDIKSIMELLNVVVSKAAIFNLSQVLEARLTYIQQKSANALNSKTDSELTDKVDKASALHVKLLPSLVLFHKMQNVFHNLQLLDYNQKTAYEFHETLIHIQDQQANLLQAIQHNQARLHQAESQMQTDVSIFESTCASLKSPPHL